MIETISPERHADVEPVSIKTPHGILFYVPGEDPISRSLAVYGEWAQAELDFLCHFICTGGTVIEIGANIGTHTLAFSRKVGPRGMVRAFEPQPIAFALLQRNLAVNACVNVLPVCVGAGAQTDEIFSLTPGHGASSAASLLVAPMSARDVGRVSMIPLDNLVLNTCNLVKADVQGLEQDVLVGMMGTVRRLRPILYFAFHDIAAAAPVFTAIEDLGYNLFLVQTSIYNPANYRGEARDFFGGAYKCGLVLVPQERSCPSVPDSACIDVVPVTSFQDFAKHLPGRLHSGEAASIDRMLERLGEELSASCSARAADQRELKFAGEKLNSLEQDNARLEFRCASLLDQLMKSERRADELANAHEAAVDILSSEVSQRLHTQDRVIASLEADLARFRGRFSSRLAAFTRFCVYRLSRHGLLGPSYARLAASGLFDEKFYLEQNPDVAAAKINPLLHFLLHGAGEGRDPSPLFDLSWYLAAYPDVAAAKINPLLHYFLHGAVEGRRPRPPRMGQKAVPLDQSNASH